MIDALAAPLQYEFFVRALAAAAIVGVVCAVVGSYLVLRGMVFLGDAISHSAFPGVVIAFLLGAPPVIGGGVAAVITALGIGRLRRDGAIRDDAAIGVLFATMFALGIAIFSAIPTYVGDLFGLLFGNVLGVDSASLLAVAVLASSIVVVVVASWRPLLFATFDPLGARAAGFPVDRLDQLFLVLVAVTIVISLQAVGIILVVAMLAAPAATAQLVADRFTTLVGLAIGIGVASSIVGLYLSFWLDAASGATIVLVQAAIFAGVLLLRRTDLSRNSGGRFT